MLGALLFFGMLGVGGAKVIYDNYDMKKHTSHYDENGNLHYMDRQCNDYINGERVTRIETKDCDGVSLYSTVGVNSSKVYDTSYGRGTQQLLDMSEKDKEHCIKNGMLSYVQYNPYFRKFVTTEIATGRTITCLFTCKNQKTGKQIYKKWYYRPECQGKYDYNSTVKGDYGIDITEEEYQKLNTIRGSHMSLPSDSDVRNDLLGRS